MTTNNALDRAEERRYDTAHAVRTLDRVKAYTGTLAFNPFMWGFGASLGFMLLSEPQLIDDNLLPATVVVATFGVRGMTQYKRLEDEFEGEVQWSTDLFRKHRKWLLYSWADANGQVPEYRRWKQMYDTEVHWGRSPDGF